MPVAITCGEMLIDFVSTVAGVTLIEAPAFHKAAGGAPANVAVGLARLGLSSGFIGKVGNDDFGEFLRETLASNAVDTTHLLFANDARTTLAFVSLRADGERDFIFYRNPGADMLFAPDEVNEDYIASAEIFHFGSITLGAQPSRDATFRAVQAAAAHGLFISYDPNLRLNLWPSPQAAREGIMVGWPHANLIKVSQEELEFLSGSADLEWGARRLWHSNLRLLVATHGASGCTYFTPEASGHIPGFAVEAVDTTGAGDAFLAALLFKLHSALDTPLAEGLIREAVRFANAAGALTATRRGAIPALPTLSEVEGLLAGYLRRSE